jgi:hypothetical protein
MSGRGVRVPSGQSKTIPVVLYADRALPAWKVSAQAIALSTQQLSTSISATLDRGTGAAGDVLSLKIARLAPADEYGDFVMIFSSNDAVAWTDTIYVGE